MGWSGFSDLLHWSANGFIWAGLGLVTYSTGVRMASYDAHDFLVPSQNGNVPVILLFQFVRASCLTGLHMFVHVFPGYFTCVSTTLFRCAGQTMTCYLFAVWIRTAI